MKVKLIKSEQSLINNKGRDIIWVQLEPTELYTSMNTSLKKSADYIVEGLCKFRKHRLSFSDSALNVDWNKVNDIVTKAATSNAIEWSEVLGTIIDKRIKEITDARLGVVISENSLDSSKANVSREEIIAALKEINDNIGDGFYGV